MNYENNISEQYVVADLIEMEILESTFLTDTSGVILQIFTLCTS